VLARSSQPAGRHARRRARSQPPPVGLQTRTHLQPGRDQEARLRPDPAAAHIELPQSEVQGKRLPDGAAAGGLEAVPGEIQGGEGGVGAEAAGEGAGAVCANLVGRFGWAVWLGGWRFADVIWLGVRSVLVCD
jgi:hypothetical protein